MKQLVLIQNQTEMANYGHADCRPALARLGHAHVLLTADTISSLDDITAAGKADAILIGSNSLHDPVIRSYLDSDEGRRGVERAIAAGAGLALMMQYKAAYDDYVLPLPSPFSTTRAVPRPATETAGKARLKLVSDVTSPPIMGYPNELLVPNLEAIGRSHPSLAGVYWHYWEADPSLWDMHLACTESDPARALVLSAREHLGQRIVLSAIPADWQEQSLLFENLVTYVLDGRHSTAFIGADQRHDVISRYLSAKLNSRGTAHRVYGSSKAERAMAAKNAVRGIHDTIFLPEQDAWAHFEEVDRLALNERVTRGTLRLVTIERTPSTYRVNISGQRSAARDAYELVVPSIGRALTDGFLDGSFRGTISGLEQLERLPHGLAPSLFPLRAVLEECQRRDRHGSYDEVIGASAALLWVRGRGLGVDHSDTRATLSWLRGKFETTDPRERLHTLGVLSDLGILLPEDVQLAQTTLDSLDLSRATELELIAFLEAATRFERAEVVQNVVKQLLERGKAGAGPVWVDIATTAGLVKALVVARSAYFAGSEDPDGAERELLELVIPAMIAVEEAYYRSLFRMAHGAIFPWDGKASTTLRCLSAWHEFEAWLAAPLEEAVEAIVQSSRRAGLSTLAEAALNSLQGLIGRQAELQDTIATQAEAIGRAQLVEAQANTLRTELRRVLARARVFAFLLTVGLYVAIDHLVRSRLLGEQLELGDSLVRHVTTHSAVAGLVIGVFAVPWDRVFSFVDARIRGWRAAE